MKKMWYMYAVEYYSAIKRIQLGHSQRREWTCVCHRERSQSGRENQIAYVNTHIWNPEKRYRFVGEIEMQAWRTDVWTGCGGRECGMNWGIRIHTDTLPCVDSQWEPDAEHRELSLLLCDDLHGWDGGGEYPEGSRGCPKGRVYMYTYTLTRIACSFCCTAELIQHCKATVPQFFKRQNLLRRGGVLLKVRNR